MSTHDSEVLLGESLKIGEEIQKLSISEQICCRWRKKWGEVRFDVIPSHTWQIVPS
jgi:hypothetical protein